MSVAKMISAVRLGLSVALVATLAACSSGGGGGGSDSNQAATAAAIGKAVNTASAAGADSAATPSIGFTAVQAGAPAVTINSPPVLRFAVFDHGSVVTNLTTSNVRFAIAKLVPGINGAPDNWVSYIYVPAVPGTSKFGSTLSQNVGSGPGGTAALASAWQATTDSGGTLKYDAANGYYTYTFGTDVKINTTNPDGKVLFDGSAVHRVAIQLSYQDSSGKTVYVNPTFDFTLDQNGNSVAYKDSQGNPTPVKQVVDASACNQCHDPIAVHGGGRVDPLFCVMCHNPGTTDPNSGNVLDFKVLVHKIHRGRALTKDYTVWGYLDSDNNYNKVGYPQDLRNCTKCHTATGGSDGVTAPKGTAQGDNWKNLPSKEACGACHDNVNFSSHGPNNIAVVNGNGANGCVTCHGPNSTDPKLRVANVHWIQETASLANYKYNIEKVVMNPDRTLTIDYSISNPSASPVSYYDLSDPLFGQVGLYVSENDNPNAPTEFFNPYSPNKVNNGSQIDLGGHHYRVTSSTSQPQPASGITRVALMGGVIETRMGTLDHTQPAVNPALPSAYVPVRAVFYDVNLSDGSQCTAPCKPRRKVVDTAKCNACHGVLGAPNRSDRYAFHSLKQGLRTDTDACSMCHDAGAQWLFPTTQNPNGYVDGNGDGLPHDWESIQFKRLIHGIHAGQNPPGSGTFVRSVDFMTGDPDPLNNPPATAPTPLTHKDYTAFVTMPRSSANCNSCHVNDSYRDDQSVLGTVVDPGTDGSGIITDTIITPRAATCSSCHDSARAIAHMTGKPDPVTGVPGSGKAVFGVFDPVNGWSGLTQADMPANNPENCVTCHGPTGPMDVRSAHSVAAPSLLK